MRISEWSSDLCSSDLVDPEMAMRLLGLFEALNRLGTTVIVATHDIHLISRIDNAQMMRLEKGRLPDPTGALRYPPNRACRHDYPARPRPAPPPAPRSPPVGADAVGDRDLDDADPARRRRGRRAGPFGPGDRRRHRGAGDRADRHRQPRQDRKSTRLNSSH